MQLLQTVFSFLVVLGILVTFHELGHYWMARRFNVKVLRFSIGFGKPLWQRQRGPDATEWVLAAIPLGGFVKMLDEREAPVADNELHRAFNRQAVWKRMLIVLAGPVANLLLAILLFWGLLATGVEDLKAVLGDIPPRTPAASAGFQAGDEVIRVNGVEIASWQAMRLTVLQYSLDGNPLTFEVRGRQHGLVERTLDLGKIDKEMLDADLLQHLGLSPIQHKSAVGFLDPSGAAAKAGMKKGDKILRIDDLVVNHWSEFVQRVRERPNLPLVISVQRGAQQLQFSVTPVAVQEQGQWIGKLGLAPEVDREAMKALMTTVRYPLPQALTQAIGKTWDNSLMSLHMFWKMLTGDLSMKNLSGPVTIADYAGQAARLGIGPFIEFLAWVSISLGVLNLLPIPLLDGGHLLYYTAEIIKGSPVSERTMEIGQHAGMVLLLGLMLFAFYNDLNRLFVG